MKFDIIRILYNIGYKMTIENTNSEFFENTLIPSRLTHANELLKTIVGESFKSLHHLFFISLSTITLGMNSKFNSKAKRFNDVNVFRDATAIALSILNPERASIELNSWLKTDRDEAKNYALNKENTFWQSHFVSRGKYTTLLLKYLIFDIINITLTPFSALAALFSVGKWEWMNECLVNHVTSFNILIHAIDNLRHVINPLVDQDPVNAPSMNPNNLVRQAQQRAKNDLIEAAKGLMKI